MRQVWGSMEGIWVPLGVRADGRVGSKRGVFAHTLSRFWTGRGGAVIAKIFVAKFFAI